MRTKIFVMGLWMLCGLGCSGDDDDGGDKGAAGSSAAGSSAAGSTSAGSTAAAGQGANAGAGSGGIAVGMPEAKNSCYAQCDAQEALTDCEPLVSLNDCKALCDGIVAGTDEECLDEFSAYYDCTVDDGFQCTIGLPGPKSDMCNDEQDALDECANGPGGTMCEGQNENGVCPQVACPCPEGTKNVSGFDTEGGSCKCLDEVTCMDLFCD